MPFNNFKDSLKSVEIYALDGYLVDIKTGLKTDDKPMENIEIGKKEDLIKLIPQYKSSWNTDRKDGKVWKFKMRYIGNQNQNVEDANPSEKEIDKEFEEFSKDVFGADTFTKEGLFQYYMYVPGKLTKAEFEEGMNEFCALHNCAFELIDQAPEAPSRQYFSENMKLMYPTVKDFETLVKNPRKFELAKDLFKESWGQEFNEESEDDREDIVLLYNEYIEELREWKPVEVKLIFPKEKVNDSKSIKDEELKYEDFKPGLEKSQIMEFPGAGSCYVVYSKRLDLSSIIFTNDLIPPIHLYGRGKLTAIEQVKSIVKQYGENPIIDSYDPYDDCY